MVFVFHFRNLGIAFIIQSDLTIVAEVSPSLSWHEMQKILPTIFQ
jgi:hypothetical protein